VKIDFAEAERKALEEAERIKQLGYDRQREEEEERARREAEALQAATSLNTPANAMGFKPNNASGHLKVVTPGFTRLGFGAIPTAVSPAAVASPSTSKYVSLYLNEFVCNAVFTYSLPTARQMIRR
jgi:ADP-ribosylation factor GTPase-activating protein 2/3